MVTLKTIYAPFSHMPDTFMTHTHTFTHAHETRPKTKVTVVVVIVVVVVSRQCKIRVKCAKRAARAEIAEPEHRALRTRAPCEYVVKFS